MNRLVASAAVLALTLPAAAHAQASLRVTPLTVDVPAPAQAGAVTFQNTGHEPISIQARVFEWSQVDGQDHYTPTTDVVASPPAATIPAGRNYTIRVARPGHPRPAGEKSYRIWVDELPHATAARPGGGEVSVRLRYDLPVFFHQAGLTSQLSWRAWRAGNQLVIEAANSGRRHARIEKLRLVSAQGEVPFAPGLAGYVLAGSTRRWTTSAANLASAPTGSATVVAGVSGSEIRQPVTLASQ